MVKSRKTEKTQEAAEQVATPRTIEEAAQCERKIGTLLTAICAWEQKLAEEKSMLDEKTEQETAPLKTEASALAGALYAFATQMRAEITQGGKLKTVELAQAGDVRWYESAGAIKTAGKIANIVIVYGRSLARRDEASGVSDA